MSDPTPPSALSPPTSAVHGAVTVPPFAAVLRQVDCPYALAGRWRYSPPAADTRLDTILERALTGIRASRAEGTDGYVLNLVSMPGLVRTREELEHLVRSALRWLARAAGSSHSVTRGDLHDPSWWFDLGGCRTFVLCFSELAPPSSPRHTFGVPGTFLVFQHDNAFSSRFPSGISVDVREAVRRRFAAAKRPYEVEPGVLP